MNHDEWREKSSMRYWESVEYKDAEHPWMIEQVSPGAVDASRLYRLFPIGDATRSAAPWWHHGTLEQKQKWYGRDGGFDSEIGWPKHLSWCKQKIAAIANGKEMILDAFVRGDRGTLVLTLMGDPRTESFDQASTLIDTLLSQPWNEEAAAHCR